MGTVVGLIILAAIDISLKKKTGLHLNQWIANKYSNRKNK